MADNEAEKIYNPWPEDFPDTTCLVPYIKLRHSNDPEIKELYDRAKNREDKEAAAELINRLVTDDGIEKIKAAAARNPDAVVVSVHAVEGRGKNAIPAFLAAFIGKTGDLEVDKNIVQTSIVSNTGQNTWHRLAHRATFEGEVKPGREYILVDDVISAGGTFSELRQFIESNGGKVVDTIAMANGAKSFNAVLAVTPEHILELENKYGVELVQRFLKEEQLYDGNHKALTDAEARTLLGAASLDEARNRIAEARQEGIYRIRSEMVPGTSPDAQEITDPQNYSRLLQQSRTELNNIPLDDAGHVENVSSALTLASLHLEEDPAFIYTPDFIQLTNEAHGALRNLPLDDAGHIENTLATLGLLAASYEAENTIHEEKTMSDYDEAEGVTREQAALGPGEQAGQREVSEQAEAPEQDRERISPEEQAFRNALNMRTQIAVSLQNGSLPCLPGADGLADTGPAVNLTTGTRYHGANLLYLKDFQKRNGFPTAEYATLDAIKKSGVPIRAGEKGVDISFAEKNSQTGEWDNKTVKLFNVAQTARPWEFKAYAEKLTAEKEQEKQTFLKSQYGDAYQSREKAEQKPGPTITCSSTEPERYLGQYLAAVSLGGAFKATPQQSAEFAQKMKDQLYKPMAESEYPDPFKLSKICRDAGVQCKEIIKEIKQPQHEVKQQREQTHSRRM